MSNSTPSLHRHIGLFALTLYGLGDILGAGVYGLIGKAAGQMGNAVWLAFFASMLAAAFTGLSYASLGSRYPKAGGAAYVVQKAYHRTWLAYGVGLAVLASGLTSMATATRVFAGYLQALFNEALAFNLIALAFILFLTFLVFWGIREALWANAIATLVEVSGLLIIIVLGFSYIGSVDYLDVTTVNNPTGELSTSLILTGAILTFYSFVGFEDILNVAEEVKNPKRTLPIGLILAVSLASIIYMLISVIAVSVVPATELSQSKEPLVEVVRVTAPWFPSSAFSLIAVFAVANTALLNFIMGSRLAYGMAREKLLPSILGRVHPTRKTPHVAVLGICGILIVLTFSGDISSLARATSVLLLLCFMIVNFALVILKLRKTEEKGSFEVPLVVPLLGSLVCAGLLFHAKAPELITAGVLLCIIAALYLFLKPKKVLP